MDMRVLSLIPLAQKSGGGLNQGNLLRYSTTFTFDEQDRPVNVICDRYNNAKGRLAQWSAPNRTCCEFGRVRVPVEGGGVWHYESGDFTSIRWRVTTVEYDMPERY
jgi:hypothetical protein